jgi:predicted dehydrogenase
MRKNNLGIGLIGAGFIGNFHIRSWVAVRDGDINGICDKNLEAAN